MLNPGDTHSLRARLSRCADVNTWCKSRRLQLNANKTEAIWFGSQANLVKLNSLDCSFRVGSSTVQPSTVVRDLGLHLDNELSMKQHVMKLLLPAITIYTGFVRFGGVSAVKSLLN